MQKPFLIYKGTDICYNILNYFAEQLGNALEQLGETVLYYDVEKDGLPGLSQFVGQEFTAIVGFQTYAFDPYLESRKCFLHDLIGGSKFNFQFDHPVWMRAHYERVPKDYYILTHDRNYIRFIKRYYPGVKDALLLPPGGTLPDAPVDMAKKDRDLVFIGTYTDYRQYLSLIKNSPTEMSDLADAFLQEMKTNPCQTAEAALKEVLKKREINLTDQKFLNLFDSLKPMIYCAMSYYREKVIEILLDQGIGLTVYGKSWEKSPFADSDYLTIQPEVTPAESIRELLQAKASLNIMAWHKDGFTERIANSMLCKSVVISDQSTCLQEQYHNGEEMILFDLRDMDELPDKIRELLAADKKREEMAEKVFGRACQEDTWKSRAALFMEYCRAVC